MILRLKGHFSYIDRYNQLKFIFIDDKSKFKLLSHCIADRVPFTDSEFTIKILTQPPAEDICDKVGLECIVHVKLKPYKFISRLDRNNGELVSGISLILMDISRYSNIKY